MAKEKKALSAKDATSLDLIPNIGRAIVKDLERIGIMKPTDLIGRDAYELYIQLSHSTQSYHDPCMLDTFMAAVDFMEGGDAKPWWYFTAERKANVDKFEHYVKEFRMPAAAKKAKSAKKKTTKKKVTKKKSATTKKATKTKKKTTAKKKTAVKKTTGTKKKTRVKKKAAGKTKKKATAKKASKKTTKKAKSSSKKKPGLYENIHKAQRRAARGGRPTRKKGEPGAPSEASFKKAAKTAKK